MQNWFFRSEDRGVKLKELIKSVNELIEITSFNNIPFIKL